MTISSINSNLAALSAQSNIGVATDSVRNNVQALSSGNRIVNASTDVAALSIGSALQSQVSILTTALTISSQGASLLQVADGGLAQIQGILQRMQTIATSAQAGSLSDVQRGFLDQEFQALTTQVDQLAGSTNFNGVSLLNGGISGANPLEVNSNQVYTAAQNATGAAVSTAPVSSFSFTSYTNPTGNIAYTNPANGASVNTHIDASYQGSLSGGTVQAVLDSGNDRYNITYVLNGVSYTGTLATEAGKTDVTATTTLALTASSTATHGVINLTLDTAIGATGDTTDESSTVAAQIQKVLAGRESHAGTASVAVSGLTTSGGVSAASFYNVPGQVDTTFVGDLSGGTFNIATSGLTPTTAAAIYTVSYNLNGSTYTGQISNDILTAGGGLSLSNGKGIIQLSLTAGSSSSTTLVTNLTTAFSGATANAIHTIRITDATDPVTNQTVKNSSIAANATNGSNNTAGTLLAGFTGANVALQSSQFDGSALPTISGFSAATSGGTLSSLSVTINGTVYSTKTVSTSSPTAISSTQFGGATAGILTFYQNGDTSNANTLTLTLTSSVLSADATNVGTQQGVNNFVDALNKVFGGVGGGIQFQVGSNSSDVINITLSSATTDTLFGHVTQNVLTSNAATTAGSAVQTAINTVTALRAGVGASEERFTFAQAAIQSAVQNQNSAKSNLLDTDVAAASTSFATSQVQLQAGIAVLAQANQLQQNLLKLIA